MQRFFVDDGQINLNEKNAFIIGEDVNHIKNVLRCKVKEQIEVCNKISNKAYLCEINDMNDTKITVDVIEELENNKESQLHINIVQGLPKADKMELIIQKCTELGVKEFTPLALKRCVVKLDSKDAIKKVDRWQKLSEVAAKQSGRDLIPKVNKVCTINDLYEIIGDYDLVLLAYENESNNMLRNELENFKDKNVKVAIIIGPEGGFEESEVEILSKKGAKVISLGNRILRTETVAMVMSSIIMYELGDLG